MSLLRALSVAAYLMTAGGCAVWHLASYSVLPDYPEFDGEAVSFAGLSKPVEVSVLEDGRYVIKAEHENDLFFVHGYLQARDRMFQMDLLRHMAQGRLGELVGNVPFGGGATSLDLDRFNRFIGLSDDARRVVESLSAQERAQADAYAAGVNYWIKTGEKALEHRLLGVEVREWVPQDSMSIFRILMFGLTHNYTRELRRLLMACDAGLDAADRIWPNHMEFGNTFLPPEDVPEATYPLAPGVVEEMREALPELCPKAPVVAAGALASEAFAAGAPLTRGNDFIDELYLPIAAFKDGLAASNNWVVAGSKTRSGKPIFENDPHLPHLKPAIGWVVQHVLPDRNIVGFALPGVHLISFGHNFHVAWGATINNVDLQDLYVEKPALLPDGREGYVHDHKVLPFTVRTETFGVLNGEPVTAAVRYTMHGPLLNDIDPFLKSRIPLTAIRMVNLEGVGDAKAIYNAGFAKDATAYVAAMQDFDSACINWVFADVDGNIGYTSPCRVPVREDWWGTFPVPGWLSKYEWKGFIPKDELPMSLNPERGWIATANNQVLPFDRMKTTYNPDAIPPNRYVRLSEYLATHDDLTVDDMAKLTLDVGISYWPALKAEFETSICAEGESLRVSHPAAMEALCDWDGNMASDSVGATIFQLLTNAFVDRALADDLSGGAEGEVWHYVQNIPHFESVVDWTWIRPATDAVWDDVRTPQKESRGDILRLALADALTLAASRYGPDAAKWQWGTVRPFLIKHPFGAKGGLLGGLFNGETFAGTGGPETVFKNQFTRTDRAAMHPTAGPVFRFIVDMAAVDEAGYALAGGMSGWPKSPHYADHTADWMEGKMRPMTPKDGVKSVIRFVPR